uniref:Uncharacterized protein n=1 Tax=Anguilla anguilla TaxID=7936 RepID=A0A0E9VAJ1_ANGAN
MYLLGFYFTFPGGCIWLEWKFLPHHKIHSSENLTQITCFSHFGLVF